MFERRPSRMVGHASAAAKRSSGRGPIASPRASPRSGAMQAVSMRASALERRRGLTSPVTMGHNRGATPRVCQCDKQPLYDSRKPVFDCCASRTQTDDHVAADTIVAEQRCSAGVSAVFAIAILRCVEPANLRACSAPPRALRQRRPENARFRYSSCSSRGTTSSPSRTTSATGSELLGTTSTRSTPRRAYCSMLAMKPSTSARGSLRTARMVF